MARDNAQHATSASSQPRAWNVYRKSSRPRRPDYGRPDRQATGLYCSCARDRRFGEPARARVEEGHWVFQPEIESQPPEARASLQGERLTSLVRRLRAVETPYCRGNLRDVGDETPLEALTFTAQHGL